jgi:hypothetical protein
MVQEEKELALEKEVKNWVDRTFNFIQLEVVEGFAQHTGREIMEYVRYKEPRAVVEEWLYEMDDELKVSEFIDACDSDFPVSDYTEAEGTIKESFVKAYGGETWIDFVDWLLAKYEDDIQEYLYEQENYPAWNTLFEFRDTAWCGEEDLQVAMKLGLGVIEGLEPFEPMLFMMSAGHSFYSAYWTPLYLSLNETARKKYEGVNYSHL